MAILILKFIAAAVLLRFTAWIGFRAIEKYRQFVSGK
jgi:hypothetical protein